MKKQTKSKERDWQGKRATYSQYWSLVLFKAALSVGVGNVFGRLPTESVNFFGFSLFLFFLFLFLA
jgi:hypothetical protein